MITQQKTPGVYIRETDAFPNSVVEVATAVPAFVGYTEFAEADGTSLLGKAVRISSMLEFRALFGGAAEPEFVASKDTSGAISVSLKASSRFLLHQGMQMFFDNGGGACWVVSVGDYGTTEKPTKKTAKDFESVWKVLEKELEPALVVIPDAVLLDPTDYANVSNASLAHCVKMQSRIAILDVYNGDQSRTYDATTDVISGTEGFRGVISSDKPEFGVVYYPWVNTTTIDAKSVDYARFSAASRTILIEAIRAEFASKSDKLAKLEPLVKAFDANEAEPAAIRAVHSALMQASKTYQTAMAEALRMINIVPPSAGMAGVYARTDNERGVFAAPANTSIVGVTSPTVPISSDDQEDLNVPLDGKSVNAIRTFVGRGVLVWGARTLDGNSQDWRYVNVRRTMIMLEQSIKLAAEAYVFAPNDASTWVSVRTMIENFLNNQWKAGALAGATPADSYDVSIGLGSTMTSDDILNGYMRITVKVAVVRPAEFIILTFQQKMQTS